MLLLVGRNSKGQPHWLNIRGCGLGFLDLPKSWKVVYGPYDRYIVIDTHNSLIIADGSINNIVAPDYFSWCTAIFHIIYIDLSKYLQKFEGEKTRLIGFLRSGYCAFSAILLAGFVILIIIQFDNALNEFGAVVRVRNIITLIIEWLPLCRSRFWDYRESLSPITNRLLREPLHNTHYPFS